MALKMYFNLKKSIELLQLCDSLVNPNKRVFMNLPMV
jgi:hypothetical protein